MAALIELDLKQLAREIAAEMDRRRPEQPQDWPAVMTVKTAARYLDRTPAAVLHLISAKDLPVVRVDNRPQLRRADIDRWIERHTD